MFTTSQHDTQCGGSMLDHRRCHLPSSIQHNTKVYFACLQLLTMHPYTRTSAGSMLDQRRRQWSNIGSVHAQSVTLNQCWINVGLQSIALSHYLLRRYYPDPASGHNECPPRVAYHSGDFARPKNTRYSISKLS